MAEKLVLVCDLCQNDGALRVYLQVGEDEPGYADICQDCLASRPVDDVRGVLRTDPPVSSRSGEDEVLSWQQFMALDA